jgi:hypothetical protein
MRVDVLALDSVFDLGYLLSSMLFRRRTNGSRYPGSWCLHLKYGWSEWPFWHSQKEKDHVYAQFRQARSVYESFARQAAGPRRSQNSMNSIRKLQC